MTMKKNEQPPQSIEDALTARPEGPMEDEMNCPNPIPAEDYEEEQTIDETVTAALEEINLEKRLGTQYPEITPPSRTERIQIPTLISPPLKIFMETKEGQKILVSTGSPQPVGMTSTQVSPGLEKKKTDLPLDSLRRFIREEEFNTNWVAIKIKNLSSMSDVIPSPTLWDIPPGITDLAKMVYDLVISPGFVERSWPCLRVLLGTSVGNTKWAASVLCTLAIYETIKILGELRG